MKKTCLAAAAALAFAFSAGAAEWISGDTRDPAKSAPVLTKGFVLKEKPARAVLTLAVAGWHEVSVNGRRVGTDVLSPVTCQPDARHSSVARDLAPYLAKGSNTVEVLLGNGWFNCFTKGAWGFQDARWLAAPQICGACVADGKTLFETDASWQAYDSPIVFNALRNGEWYDARREGTKPNLRPAKVEFYAPTTAVSPEDAVPCRASEPLAPKKVIDVADGVKIYDFGSNRSGWCEIEVVGEAGAKVTLDYDELLTQDGKGLFGAVNNFQRWNKDPRPGQHDEYTLAGRAAGETWHPRFTYHGFRYVKVTTVGKVTLKRITSWFVHSDFKANGSFTIADATFAKLLDAARRSYLSNFVGIPTDCPHREKNGWTGDTQLAMETGLWSFDAAEGYRHFLRMMLDAQRPNGAVPCILPTSDKFGFFWGSGPAWDAVLFEIPEQLFRFYGDDSAAREAYPAMKRYLKFIATKQRPDGLLAYGLGDWCPPQGHKAAPVLLTDSAYVYAFNRRAAFWADRFGEREVAAACRAEAARIRAAFNREFYKGKGVYGEGQLTALAAPLYFPGLVADGAERETVAELVRRVRAQKHQAWFGILGAKWVPRVLAAHGYVDDAWKFFVQPEEPGWARWVTKWGEDSLWETWNGDSSHNHIMYGDFPAWAYEYVAGIKLVQGRVETKPHLPEGVAGFDVSYRTVRDEVIRVVASRNKAGKPVYKVTRTPRVRPAQTVDLAGEWRLAGTDAHDKPLSCAMTVPGDVHSALRRNKLMEDPFWGCNETNVQWIGARDWTVSRTFDVTPALLARDEVVFVADDVDCFAEIFVNGKKIGVTNDRFLRWTFDVKPFLKPGRNEIRAVFASAWKRSDALAAAYAKVSSNKVGICRFEHEWVHNHVFARKDACHKGWDWGPSQMVTGFCGPVRLVGSDRGQRVEYVWADTDFNAGLTHCTLTAYAQLSGGTVVTNREEIPNPPLWWPAGQGEQKFYTYSIRAGGETLRRRIGLRKLEVDTTGRGMTFKVNNRPIFMKGANWIPCSSYDREQTPARYGDLLRSAKRANMNMLRLWGGGQYEKDVFYDLCDELGLLVWHDQMFACGAYPEDDPAFVDLVSRECRHQMRRLRDHACVALWCGGNECRVPVAVEKAAAQAVDPSRTFWPSSPCGGPDDTSGTTYGSDTAGDMHNWFVWHCEKSFDEYYRTKPRFCSEFGFQSFSSREVALQFCAPENLKSGHPDFEWHQKNQGGNDRIRNTFARYFRAPRNMDETLYLSQVQQALAIKTAVEGWRTQRPHCMGALFWQLNDCWPVASWSSVEYGGKWKHLQYQAKRFYAPVAVVGAPTGKAGEADVWALNDTAADVPAKVTVEVRDFTGKVLETRVKNVVVPALGTLKVDTLAGKSDVFLALEIAAPGVRHANEWLFAAPKDCPMAAAKVTAEVKGLSVTLRTDRPAFFVWANAFGIPGEFDDNSFTLLPDKPVTLTFRPADRATTPEAFAKALSVSCLW